MHLLEVLSEEDKVRRTAFYENFITELEEDETLDSYSVCDEATFPMCGIINSMHIWGIENPHDTWSSFMTHQK
jgi:hypothetical protein